ncbi:NAD(P)-dependent oxidoreductase [Alkalilimnicola sp. S0819]|nr:NAD(P)-dependent oxidoreductase [Alkalilimnicola sp. S0819]KAB7623984.1 NAD(P)-dependent oxidoreductase [Alkalilimnicola sp. S0819]MPQ16588.1 NAD-binding protein [Alkalilimnicola sp. S0819]
MKTGFIGLGGMGRGMAANLHRAGLLSVVYNRSYERAIEFAGAHGVTAADEIPTLAAECELIFTCVSRDEDVLDVIDAMLPALRPGSIVVDCSTIAVDTAKEAARRLAERDARFLDAPVSGGVEGARNGQLVMMVGGDPAVLERVRPALDAMSKAVTHMGEVGAGQATKAVNQIMAAGINQAVTEALAFGQASGLDMDKVIQVVGGGAAGNWFVNHRGPTMTRGVFEPGFKVALHHKDLGICRKMLEARGVALPVVEMTLKHYERLMEQGHGEEDISALYRLKRAMFQA